LGETLILAVSFEANDAHRQIISETLGKIADIRYPADLKTAERQDILSRTDVLLAKNTAKEIRPEELPLLCTARLISIFESTTFHSMDCPRNTLSRQWRCLCAANGGACACPMALAAAKRLLVEHLNLSRGQFNQFTPNRVLAGKVCGCFGFGGYGVAMARLMRCLGMRIHAINRRGAADEPVDWIGPPDRLHALMAASDVLVISAPLNRATQGVIGERVSLM
jgi:phosphoglycerate dehydrogenase-like enzyme